MTNWYQVLGKNLDEVQRTLQENFHIELSAAEDIKEYSDGASYYCFYEKGIALCFINEHLDSIDFYRPAATSRYKPVSDQLLPAEIKTNDTGKTLVQRFGEPTQKGAGRIDIWLRWDSKQLEVQIPDRDWDQAKNKTWSSITINK